PAAAGGVSMSLAPEVLQALGDPVIAVDPAGAVLVWTPAAERLLGFAAGEVLGRALPEVGIRLDTLPAGRGRRLTLRHRHGAAFPATVTATPLLGARGEGQGVVLLVKDLTPWIGPSGSEAMGTEAQNVEERLGAAFRGILEATSARLERGGRVGVLGPNLGRQGRGVLAGSSRLVAVVPAPP